MGLVETDPKKIDEYKARKMLINTGKEIEALKSDVASIKEMLRELINGVR